MVTDALAPVLTLVEALRERVRLSGPKPWLTLYAKDRVEVTLTFGELLDRASLWAGTLAARGVGQGDRVLMVLPTASSFYESYWGILLAGAVPVPAYPPVRLGRMEDYFNTLRGLARNSGASLLITDDLIRPVIRPAEDVDGKKLPFLLPKEVASRSQPPTVSLGPGDLALLQYTSGSTGNQKGVSLSHGNLLANLRAIGAGVDMRPDDVAVSWLPLYHDMGLIGLMLGTFYWGIPLIAMSPIDFLRRPARWLRALSDHRATLTAGPNFAYSLTARKVRDVDLAGLDLSALRVALCGAEPIYPATIDGFSRRYGPCGFRPESFFPAYGLAEGTLAVSFSDLDTQPLVAHVDARALEVDGAALPVAPGEGARAVVSCGRPLPTVEVRIQGEDGTPLPEGRRGDVLVRGPSVMAGYYRNDEATAQAVRGGWLYTGDLGFLLDGRLYLSGRKKDLVIKAGRNYFAEDLEAAATGVAGVRPGGLCVFAVEDGARGSEEVVLVAEVAPGAKADDLPDALRKAVGEATGCRPDRVVLVPPHTLPKTSSGKLQRFKTRQWYLEGSLEARGGERQTSGLWFYVKARLRDLWPFGR